ncbi:hypothetical protein LINGRAHAP2_LOCUS16760, partial [Linum grandiflorum]
LDSPIFHSSFHQKPIFFSSINFQLTHHFQCRMLPEWLTYGEVRAAAATRRVDNPARTLNSKLSFDPSTDRSLIDDENPASICHSFETG